MVATGDDEMMIVVKLDGVVIEVEIVIIAITVTIATTVIEMLIVPDLKETGELNALQRVKKTQKNVLLLHPNKIKVINLMDFFFNQIITNYFFVLENDESAWKSVRRH